MATAGAVWIPVLPDMSGFNKQVRAGATAGMATAGKNAGRSYGTAATSAVKGAGISKAMATETQAGAVASAKAIETQTARMVSARNRAANAAGSLRVAETKLTELRNSGKATTSQMAAAEERVAKAQRGSQMASSAAASAQRTLVTSGTAAQKATQSLGTAVETAAVSTSRFGRIGSSAMSAVKSGAWSVASAVPAVGNFTAGLRSSDAAASAFTGRMGTFGGKVSTAVSAASSRFGALGSAVGRGGSALVGFGRSVTSSVMGPLGQTARMMAPLAGIAGFVGLAKGAWAASTSIDTTSRTLTGLYGSGTQATSMMGKLRTLATNSPIDYQSYFTAAQNLAYMGVKGDEAIQVMTNLGKASIVAGKGSAGLDQANTALLQMVNSGKVYADQLNQISGAGVPIFSGLAAKFNTNIANVRTMVTEGKVGVQDVLSVIKNGTGATYQQTIAAANQVSKSVGSQWTQLKNKMALASGQMFAPLVSFVGNSVLPALNGLFGFVSRNQAWIRPIAIGLGVATLAVIAMTAAVWLWNTALFANPVVWVIGALIGLAAIIGYLATRTQFFQTIWSAVSGAFIAAWNWFGSIVSLIWSSVLSPVFNAIGFAARILAAVVITVLVTPLVLAWRGLASVALWLWNAAIHPVFSWIGGLATWLWVNALAPAFRGIGAVFMWLWRSVIFVVVTFVKAYIRAWGAVFSWLYTNVISPVGRAIGAIFMWLWRNVISPVVGWIKAGLSALGAAFSWVYNNVIRPVWSALGSAIHAVWPGVVSPAFNAMKRGVQLVGSAFNTAVGFIQRVWNKIKAIAAAPINFVINTVYNHGIKAVWDKVAGFLGLGKLPAAAPVKFATGGHVRGPGGPTADRVPAMLSNDEFVVRSAIAKRSLPFLTALNAGNAEALTATGGPSAKLPGYKRGGLVANTGGEANSAVQRGLAVAKSYDRKPYIWGGVGPGGVDCSGLMSVITNALRGESNIHHRLGVARSQPWPGFVSGLSSAFSTGFNATHTAGTLGGVNVESSKTPIVFPGKHGADDRQFSGHASLPIVGGKFVSGGAGGGGGGLISFIVNKILDPVRGLIKRNLPNTPLWKSMPRGASLKLVDGVANWLSSKDTSGGAGQGAPGSGPVVAQVRGVANGYGWGNGPQWDALNWLISHESSWNPNAKNPGSTAYGLFQFLDSTWSQYGGRSSNPAQQARGGMQYIKSRYHDPLGAKAFWQSHHWYDNGGWLPEGPSLVMNRSGAPEPVFSPRQWATMSSAVGGDGASADTSGLVFNATYNVERSPEEHAAATARALAREVRRLA